jgi:hypothetical protein
MQRLREGREVRPALVVFDFIGYLQAIRAPSQKRNYLVRLSRLQLSVKVHSMCEKPETIWSRLRRFPQGSSPLVSNEQPRCSQLFVRAATRQKLCW